MKRLLPAHYLSVSRNSALPVAAGVSGVLANSNGKAVASCAAGERDAKSWFRGALCLLLHERLNNDFGNQELFCLPNPFLLLSGGGEWKKRKRKKTDKKFLQNCAITTQQKSVNGGKKTKRHRVAIQTVQY